MGLAAYDVSEGFALAYCTDCCWREPFKRADDAEWHSAIHRRDFHRDERPLATIKRREARRREAKQNK